MTHDQGGLIQSYKAVGSAPLIIFHYGTSMCVDRRLDPLENAYVIAFGFQHITTMMLELFNGRKIREFQHNKMETH